MAWKDSRPMSPHLQVYRLPLTALISIGHRATGAALAGGMLFLVWAVASAAAGPESFETAQAVFGSWFGKLVLFGFTAALYLHFFNGLRHMVWDAGKGFDLEHARLGNKIVLGGTAVMTVLTWIVASA